MGESGYLNYDGDEDMWPPPRSGHRARGSGPNMLLIGAIVVIVLLVAVAVAVFVLGRDDQPFASSQSPARVRPSSYVTQDANPHIAKINYRARDRRPLTQGEVFNRNAKNLTHENYTFTLVGSQLTQDCRSAVWGERLQQDLQSNGCAQIARGVYLSKDKKYAGQFFAINMNTLRGAQQIMRDLDPGTGSGFVLPISAPSVPEFGQGFSAAYVQPFGHYVIVSWVQRLDGGEPKSMNEMVDTSIAIERADGFAWERLVLAGG